MAEGVKGAPPGASFQDWIKARIEDAILASRYLLVPFFGALLFVIFTIGVDFFKVLMNWAPAADLIEHTLQALELLDFTMIANLIWLISAGSYYVFVDTNNSKKPRPRSLIHVSAGLLKEKMAGSIVGVSSVYLLQVFLNAWTSAQAVDWSKLGALLLIHLVFILGFWVFNRANEADHHNHTNEEEKKDVEATR